MSAKDQPRQAPPALTGRAAGLRFSRKCPKTGPWSEGGVVVGVSPEKQSRQGVSVSAGQGGREGERGQFVAGTG